MRILKPFIPKKEAPLTLCIMVPVTTFNALPHPETHTYTSVLLPGYPSGYITPSQAAYTRCLHYQGHPACP